MLGVVVALVCSQALPRLPLECDEAVMKRRACEKRMPYSTLCKILCTLLAELDPSIHELDLQIAATRALHTRASR